MKVLLLEGLDNVGKSFIAEELMVRYKNKYNILFMHSRSPEKQENVSPLTYQGVEFFMKADTAAHMAIYEECKDTYIPENQKHPLSETLCIFDRSWLDEYVYGQIYRNEELWEILLMITNCFEALTQPGVNLDKMQIAIVYLDSTPEFSISKDDGKSFTSDIESYNQKRDTVYREYRLFSEVCNYCKENNLCDTVRIDVQANETDYRPKDAIISEMIDKLSKIGIEL